jgi:hypothetical protein
LSASTPRRFITRLFANHSFNPFTEQGVRAIFRRWYEAAKNETEIIKKEEVEIN